MNEVLGFSLLAVVVISAILCPVCLYRGFTRSKVAPIAIAGLAGVTAIFCSIPFYATYEMPWLPELTAAYFIMIALVSIAFVPRRNISVAKVAVSAVALAACLMGLKTEYSERAATREAASNAWYALTDRGINLHYGPNNFDMVSFSEPQTITDAEVKELFVPALRDGRMKISAIDLKGTRVTNDGIEVIKAAVPNWEIRR